MVHNGIEYADIQLIAEAYDLLTHVARISVGYFALGTVAVKIEKKYLSGR